MPNKTNSSWRAVRAFAILGTIAALSACAMSSGVMKLGPDTYSISVAASPVRGGNWVRKKWQIQKRISIAPAWARRYW